MLTQLDVQGMHRPFAWFRPVDWFDREDWSDPTSPLDLCVCFHPTEGSAEGFLQNIGAGAIFRRPYEVPSGIWTRPVLAPPRTWFLAPEGHACAFETPGRKPAGLWRVPAPGTALRAPLIGQGKLDAVVPFEGGRVGDQGAALLAYGADVGLGNFVDA